MTAVLMIGSMATLVQSYVAIKLFFVGLFLLAATMSIVFGTKRFVVYARLVWFYVWISLAGVAWALVGLLHPTNYIQGVMEALRLYVIWSAAFVILYTLLRAGPSLKVIHTAMVLAGILIPLINFAGMYDQFYGLGLISDSIREELDMQIGFGDGWIQITSQNIDVMFLIVPYLLSLQFRADGGKSNTVLTKIALALSLILVAVSGRRALWIVVALTPCLILLLSAVTESYGLMKTTVKRCLLACAATSVIALGTVFILPQAGQEIGSISRFKDAFSSDDYRTIQKPYLLEGFSKSPIFGSGFGAYAGYTRSDERPWNYELTYHKMLFNLGIVGVTALGALFFTYLFKVVQALRHSEIGSAVPFALLIGYCSFFIGAYSNPYFGSFDLLFFVGLLPYLSTFQRGFDCPQSTAGATI